MRQAPERAKVIQAEVQKLVEAGIMSEVYYHEWLSNPVMGYHQIQMAELDEEKMAFHTSQGVYCYTKMPFGLKNAGATYQRLVDKAFDSQVGRNMEVYVDDLVIKSHTEEEMIRDINETFRTLRRINMKLNPKKCTFGAREGMFLGYMISPEGIKPCPDKTEAVLQLPSPRTIKEVQSLNGKLASLNSGSSPTPKPKEELIVYLAASHGAVNAVLMAERDTVQTPVYFVSRTLQGPDLNYSPMEKLILSLVFTAKRLRRYFQAHPIVVVTDQPIKQIMSRPDVAGRLQKWSVMLGEHNITYRPRTSVKGQILADFLVEKPDENLPETPATDIPQEPWTLFTDGSSCIDGSGAGADGSTQCARPQWYYFTKWIEAKAVATITRNQVKKFAWDNIVCRFGLLEEIVSDNGKQFSDNPFKDWCDKLNITQRFASVKHPQSNGLVERANRSLGEGIKARLGEGNKNWVEELPHVLWAHRTMIKSSHGDTPFSLTYGTEAVIPVEIRMPTYRTVAVDTVHNDEDLRLNLDLLEEKRERTTICEAKAKMKMTKYYNARVRGVAFKPGDFVYRNNDASHAVASGKLGPKWEGPYEVTEALGDGAYKLSTR
ncbi:reverse transcriptase domain-containing protein [Tanacetum coccineum]